jgi:methionyl-tRNA formyltransferase
VNVVFLGTPHVAVPFLDFLADSPHEVPLVVTRADRPVGRSGTPQPPPVKRTAVKRGLEVVQPRSVKKSVFLDTLRAAEPDVIVVVAYGRILPTALLEIPRLGAVNVHFSLLPLYRGAAPVQWCLARGETRTGVTTMSISEGLDEGDILLQRELEIDPGEHAPALFQRLCGVGRDLLDETLARLETGDLTPTPQDHDRATFAPLLTRKDGQPPVDLPAREIEGRVRGFDPWPGVWFGCRGRRVRLLGALALPAESAAEPPGRVLSLRGDDLLLACGAGTVLAVSRLQPEGRRGVSGRDAANGRLLGPGDDLEPLDGQD